MIAITFNKAFPNANQAKTRYFFPYLFDFGL